VGQQGTGCGRNTQKGGKQLEEAQEINKIEKI
jgi:hypothetical protein